MIEEVDQGIYIIPVGSCTYTHTFIPIMQEGNIFIQKNEISENWQRQ